MHDSFFAVIPLNTPPGKVSSSVKQREHFLYMTVKVNSEMRGPPCTWQEQAVSFMCTESKAGQQPAHSLGHKVGSISNTVLPETLCYTAQPVSSSHRALLQVTLGWLPTNSLQPSVCPPLISKNNPEGQRFPFFLWGRHAVVQAKLSRLQLSLCCGNAWLPWANAAITLCCNTLWCSDTPSQ